MEKSQRSMLVFFMQVLLLITGPVIKSAAQPGKTPVFTIVSLPRKANYSKVSLNKELAKLTSREEVKKLVKRRNILADNIIIRVEEKNKPIKWWTISTILNTELESDDLVLRSKVILPVVLNRPGDFKTVFYDSLVLLDTLGLSLNINSREYPDTAYVIKFLANETDTTVRNIPLINGQLVFTSELLYNARGFTDILICNSRHPERTLAKCNVKFLTGDDKEVLLQLAEYYRETHKRSDIAGNADFLHRYISTTIGPVYYPQLSDWLTQNLR